MIRPSVLKAFRGYSEGLEGRTRNPYLDVKGLVTVSIGCLVDPLYLAIDLPWMVGDRFATHDEIRADWEALKARQDVRNWRAEKQAALTTIRLTNAGVDALMWRRLEANFGYLRRSLMPGIGDFPADALLGVLSLAWAVGAGFNITKPPRDEFVAACNAGDWAAAGKRSNISEIGNAGVIARNAHQRLCFANAAIVEKLSLDRAALFWPGVPPAPGTVAPTDTHAADLRRAAILAQSMAADVVGNAGANLRAYELAEADEEPEPAA